MAAVHVNQQKEKTMKTEFERHMESGILGDYRPESAVLQQAESGGINTTFRDTECWIRPEGQVRERKMWIEGRCFQITSVFPIDPSTTPTDKLLTFIDADLKKESTGD
jgi:hypothetical protein